MVRLPRVHSLGFGFAFVVGLVLSGSSSAGCVGPNPDHCLNNDGDAYCASVHPDWATAFCLEDPCGTPTVDGCYETPAPGDCSETSGDGDGDGDGDTIGDGDGETSDLPPECRISADCEPNTPICDAGSCVACSETALTCADEYGLPLPVCDASSGACVLCTSDDASACPTATPICEANECVPCTEHAQCPESACELDVGTCFASAPVVHVDGDQPCPGNGMIDEPFCTIEAGVVAVVGKGVVIVHQAAAAYFESITITGDRQIAVLGAPGELPVWRNDVLNGVEASLRADNGSDVYVDRITLSGSSGSGLFITAGGRVFLTSASIVDSQETAIEISDGSLWARNAFIGTAAFATAGITLTIGELDIAYSTLGVTSGPVLICENGGLDVTLRDSIALTYDDVAELDCVGATLDGVFVEANAMEEFTPDSAWFEDFPNGDFHLDAAAPTEFITPLSIHAMWASGDPRVDIDAQPRNAIDGRTDFAGADVPNP